MSKELEIITEYIKKIEEYEKKTGKQYSAIYMSKEFCIAIKEKLQRLEAIDNANPSEALECLQEIEDRYDMLEIKYVFGNKEETHIPILNFNIIKQALIQAEHDKKLLKIYEQENENQFNNIVDKEKKALAFEIIKEKEVRLWQLRISADLESYNYHCLEEELTQEEFDLLKEVLG